MNELYNRIETLCDERGVSVTEMCRASGASRGSLTDLKMGRVEVLSAPTLSKIAEFFGVTIDNLMGKEKPAPISGDGPMLDLSGLSEADRELVRQFAERLLDAQSHQ